MKLLYEELTYKIRSCIYEVRNEIGSGFDEETYHQGIDQFDIAHVQSYLKAFKTDPIYTP